MPNLPPPLPGVPAGHDPYAPLRVRNFRWFMGSVLTMALGAQIQGVVVAWQIYSITKDPLSLGMVGLAEALPFIGLALYAGHVADVVDRRRVALWALGVLTACALALAVLSRAEVAWSPERPSVRWAIYGVIMLCGAARSFLLPARSALSAEVVPRALYPSAVAWRTGIWQIAAVTGPALGGLLYGLFGATAAYTVSAILMAMGFGAVAQIKVPARVATSAAAAPSLITSLREGLSFLFGRRLFLGAMTLDLFAVLFGGAVAILPVFAEQILHVGPEGLGMLRAAPAAGAVVMSAALALRPPLRRAGGSLLLSVAIFGLCMVAFALSRSFWLSLALLAGSGAADMLSIYVRSTLLQVMVPTAMLGRISSVNQIFIGSSNEIGAFESGVAARLLGTIPSVVAGGLITVAVVAVTAWRFPELRRLKKLEAPPDGSIG
jgi:MFS family permease